MSPKSKSNRSIVKRVTTLLPHNHIRQQFQKIIASPEFHATRQQRDFLTFVIMETLAGRYDNLKGYTVATQVLGRAEDFDASVEWTLSSVSRSINCDGPLNDTTLLKAVSTPSDYMMRVQGELLSLS